MKLLHFTGEGYGEMEGISEYVVIIEDGEDAKEYVAPGFELRNSLDLLACSSDMLPLNTTLIPRN